MAFISNGTTILDNGAFSVGLGGLVLLSEQTASNSASISFTSGIDSTYDIYKFEFISIHPASDAVNFTFQASTDGGSNYGVTMTSTYFTANHDEANTFAVLAYETSLDQAQGTSFQRLARTGNGNDESCSGTLTLFNPSSTTYVKHFISNNNEYNPSNLTQNSFVAGYFNTTTAINAIQFKMNSGNMDDGIIKMYGIKGS